MPRRYFVATVADILRTTCTVLTYVPAGRSGACECQANHIDSSLHRNRRTQIRSSDLKAEALALFRFLQVGPRGCRYEQASVQLHDRILNNFGQA
jgi:hypothetical protein